MFPAGLEEMNLAENTRNLNDLASVNLTSLVFPLACFLPLPQHRAKLQEAQGPAVPWWPARPLPGVPFVHSLPQTQLHSLRAPSLCRVYYLGLKLLTRLCVRGTGCTLHGVPGTWEV